MEEDKDKTAGLPKNYVGKLSPSTARARKKHWEKMSKYSDRDPRAYEPAPGDATAKTKPSKATLEVRKMMKEAAADASLSAKAKKSGISVSTLKAVYRRGVAAWNSGHRPGTTPQQWGHARVNSYIRKGKGTYHGADKDLREAKDAREYGYEGEMVMSQLKGMINHANQLHDMLEPDTDLPEWVQSKITLAYDYIQTAADYMASELDEDAPANAAGGGNIAGMGVGPDGEPGVGKNAMKRYKDKNAADAPKAGRKSFTMFMKAK